MSSPRQQCEPLCARGRIGAGGDDEKLDERGGAAVHRQWWSTHAHLHGGHSKTSHAPARAQPSIGRRGRCRRTQRPRASERASERNRPGKEGRRKATGSVGPAGGKRKGSARRWAPATDLATAGRGRPGRVVTRRRRRAECDVITHGSCSDRASSSRQPPAPAIRPAVSDVPPHVRPALVRRRPAASLPRAGPQAAGPEKAGGARSCCPSSSSMDS